MNLWGKWIAAAAATLLLTGCLWGPGKFTSTLTLTRDGSFTLAYTGEIMLQRPDDLEGRRNSEPEPWTGTMARAASTMAGSRTCTRPCPRPATMKRSEGPVPSAAETAKLKSDWERKESERLASKRRDADQMAQVLGLPGIDDASNQAFAAKLMKYAGWRSVQYRGKGVFVVDYYLQGRATQDFLFPAMPQNDMVMPFVALRRRADGSVEVSAPMFAGYPGMIGRAAMLGMKAGNEPGLPTRAQGRFTIITDGEILTNNSEDGPLATTIGRRLVWEVTPEAKKIPEALIRL
jgi:hypothetical protein